MFYQKRIAPIKIGSSQGSRDNLYDSDLVGDIQSITV